MKQSVWKLLCCVLLISAMMLSFATSAEGRHITWQEENGALSIDAIPTLSYIDTDTVEASASVATVSPTLAVKKGPSVNKLHSATALKGLKLLPGGMPFGVKFFTDGVTVVGFGEVKTNGKTVTPATEAGMRAKDVILKINGEPIKNAAHLTEAIEGCGGKVLTLLCKRGNKEIEIQLTPVYSSEEARYKTGIWVRDSGAGIGTVTFIVPETGAFAGLGHGICDADTGELIAMRRGSVSNVTISSVVRGTQGAPGELKGYFNAGKIGSLLGNSACGVWGVFSSIPKCDAQPLEIGLRDEIVEGDAEILCTLDNNQICKYSVKISNINRDAKASKCFNITITDPDLIAASGGIVQGMGVCYNRDNTVKLE